MPPVARKSSSGVKASEVHTPLAKGKACSTCKARKVRCDAGTPACSACKRTARFEGRDPDLVVCGYGKACSVRPNRGAGSGAGKGKGIAVDTAAAPRTSNSSSTSPSPSTIATDTAFFDRPSSSSSPASPISPDAYPRSSLPQSLYTLPLDPNSASSTWSGLNTTASTSSLSISAEPVEDIPQEGQGLQGQQTTSFVMSPEPTCAFGDLIYNDIPSSPMVLENSNIANQNDNSAYSFSSSLLSLKPMPLTIDWLSSTSSSAFNANGPAPYIKENDVYSLSSLIIESSQPPSQQQQQHHQFQQHQMYPPWSTMTSMVDEYDYDYDHDYNSNCSSPPISFYSNYSSDSELYSPISSTSPPSSTTSCSTTADALSIEDPLLSGLSSITAPPAPPPHFFSNSEHLSDTLSLPLFPLKLPATMAPTSLGGMSSGGGGVVFTPQDLNTFWTENWMMGSGGEKGLGGMGFGIGNEWTTMA